MKLQRPEGNYFNGMEESDGAKYTSEEDNAEDDIEDIAKNIVEYVLGNYYRFPRNTNEFNFFTNLLLLPIILPSDCE